MSRARAPLRNASPLKCHPALELPAPSPYCSRRTSPNLWSGSTPIGLTERISAGAKHRLGMPKPNSTGRPQNNYRSCASTTTWGRDQTLSTTAPAAFPARLGPAIACALAGSAERGWTDALAGIILAGAVGNAGVAGGIGQAPFPDRDVVLTCRGGSNQQQGQHCTEHELHGYLRLHGLRGCQKRPMRGGGEDHRRRFPACQSRIPRCCDRSLERP